MNKGIIFNLDADRFFSIRSRMPDMGKDITLKTLTDFIDQYKGTGITDFLMDMGAMTSVCPSKVLDWAGDRWKITEERGQKVDYSKSFGRVVYEVWHENGLDAFAIWINRLRENGINPWISFRMNDSHSHFFEPSDIVPPYYFENYDRLSRVRHRQQMMWFDRCHDYELDEIRDLMKARVTELLDRYDVYGIELDFQRDLWCFQLGHEQRCAKLLTEFVGQIKEIVKSFESKYNHDIKISARCNPNPLDCLEQGFDILEWAKRGYIDWFTACGRFHSTDNDMPIEFWKKALEPYGVKVAGGIESLIKSRNDLQHGNNIETALGSLANILSQGADKVYLFNYIDYVHGEYDHLLKPIAEFNQPDDLYDMLCIAGDLDEIKKRKRRNVITIRENRALWRENDSIFPIKSTRTACIYEESSPLFAKIITGYVNADSKITLRLAFSGVEDPEKKHDVYVNSEKCTFIGITECEHPKLVDGNLYCYSVPTSALYDTYTAIAEVVHHKTNALLEYADIVIE